MKDGSDLRVTFDENILARTDCLDLREEIYGTSLIDEDMTLMEIKTSNSIPIWLVQVLSEQKVFKTSFSKYGKAYIDLISEGGKAYDSSITRII